MNRKLIPLLEVTFAVVVWGGSFVATKLAVREVAPLTVIWLRFGIGLAVLWPVVWLRRQFAFPAKQDLAYLALLGFIGITFHQWLQSTALITSQASTTAWIVATIPVFMVLLGWAALHEPIRRQAILGIALAAAGVFLVVSKGEWAVLAGGKFGAPGDFLVLLSSPNWAIFSVLSRRGLKTCPPARLMAYVMSFGWLFTTILFLAGPGPSEIRLLTLPGWTAILFLGVACSGLAYIFWYDALQALPIAQVGAFIYVEPLVTVLVAALLLSEPLLGASLLGGAAILAGVWLVQLS